MNTYKTLKDGEIESHSIDERNAKDSGRNGASIAPKASGLPRAAEAAAPCRLDGPDPCSNDCDDDDDVIVVELKNGCDYARLEKKNIVSSLEKVHLKSNEPAPGLAMTAANKARQTAIHLPGGAGSKHQNLKAPYNQNAATSNDAKETDKQTILQPSKSTNTPRASPRLGECAPEAYERKPPKGNPNSEYSKLRQLAFLKSQSLDLCKDESTLSHGYPYANCQMLPDISENRATDTWHPAASNDDSLQSLNTMLATSEAVDLDKAAEEMGGRVTQRPTATAKLQSIESRPIYPNVPYSPYASPYGSPGSNRRRPPLRESRRISIEKSGSFLQLNQYKLMDQIGQGSYGLVKLAYSEEDSTHYAMKILSKRRLLRQAGLMRRGPKKATSPLDRVYREIAVLKKLDHPNVVKLVEVLDDPVEDSLYMVFELVKQGEVLSIPTDKPLPEERAWSVFRDCLLGLEYLHYQKIIHADLKPGNLLLTECGHVKIADLGVCNEFLGEDATMTNGSTAGTPAFRAPETLVLGQNVYCGRAADIWALGATLYALVFGNVPFQANSIPLLYEKIKNDDVIFPTTPRISDKLQRCIGRMLEKDAAQRITLPELKTNNWVTGDNTCPLPTEDENCRLVQVDDEDIRSVVHSVPKLDTLILIKTMLKKHSFGNPFVRGISGRAPQRGGSRLERFVRAGRSNSAPGSYHLALDRQPSADDVLPALTEHCPSHNNEES